METVMDGTVLVLSGGVGGAKFCAGMQAAMEPDHLTIAVNTGDDFDYLGLRVCPDIDSVIYALSGQNDVTRGWGRSGESWNFMSALAELSTESWFQLGDRDLAMHVVRTAALKNGQSLSSFTNDAAKRLGAKANVLPMSDAPVSTRIRTPQGVLDFQRYFVGLRCEPAFEGIELEGLADAQASDEFLRLLKVPNLRAVIIAPSNPYLSIDPILGLKGVKQALRRATVPVVAVSPLVGGKSVKGPLSKILSELGVPPTPATIAAHYAELIDALVVDASDAHLVDEALPTLTVSTMMNSPQDAARLAHDVLQFVDSLSGIGTDGGNDLR